MTRAKHKPTGYLNRRIPRGGPFSPPFALDGYAKREWYRILQVAPWLTEADAHAIADRCLCAERVMTAEEDIRRRGPIIRSRNDMVKNQSLSVVRQYRASLQKFDESLGLTPTGRERLSDVVFLPVRGSKDDPLERALSQEWRA
jgi:P27 family predicted phage terminase small subunit